jgi:DNA helicase-2/ATP-dependent DNA helicase PcrA
MTQNSLTPLQLSAVSHSSGPLLLIAGPGAGKTRVIIEKCVHLINECHIAPENLLVTTFTNKATLELYDRLYNSLGPMAQKITVSTIHSFCKSLLSSFPGHNPLGAHFEVLDGEEQFLFVYDNLKALGLSSFPKKRLAEFIHDVISFFNLCTEECVDPGKLAVVANLNPKELLGLKVCSDEAVDEYCSVAEAYGEYRDLLKSERLVDFALLQETAYAMVRDNAEVRDELRRRYKYVLIDEYQDTNRLQVLLFKEITAPEHNICAVGDDDQSIYGFRGASVHSFRNFTEDFPNAKEIPLAANFRSTPVIVDATSSLIEHNAPDRKPKKLESARNDYSATPVNCHEPTAPKEAQTVIDALYSWKNKGIISSWNDVAILLRSVRSHAGPYIEELQKSEIPYVAFGQCTFFERQDMGELRDVLRFCGNKSKCPVSGIRQPLFDFANETLEVIAGLKDNPAVWNNADAIDGLTIPDKDLPVLKRLARIRKGALDGEYKHHMLGLFYDVLDCSGYLKRILTQCSKPGGDSAESALFNLAVFSGLISRFQKRVRSSNLYKLNEYLYFIKESIAEAGVARPGAEAVRIMTVHQAKGLEFPVVVIGAAMEQRFPVGFRRPKYPVPASLRISGNVEDEPTHRRDERRLFYVAMTRARDLLVIGSADKVNVRGGGPSKFIQEIKQGAIVKSIGDIKEKPPRNRQKAKAPDRKRLSYSGLHTYVLCPLQYKLIYECGFSVPQVYWAYFGGAVHNVLEHIHKLALHGSILTPGDLPELWKTMWKPPQSWDNDRKETMGNTGLWYLDRYIKNYGHRLSTVYWVEEQIEIPVPETDVLLTGRLDLACKVSGGIQIIDFKIRKRIGLEVMREDLQVQVYALAAKQARGETVSGITLHLLGEKPGNEVLNFAWDNSIEKDVDLTIRKACRGIQDGKFDARPGIHCRFCDFRSLCTFSAEPERKKEQDDEIALGTEAQKIG